MSVERCWLTQAGAQEVILLIRGGQACLGTREGCVMPISLHAAQHLRHKADHRVSFRELTVEGADWKGRYRCYDGRLRGVCRFLLDEGPGRPEGLGSDVTSFDLEVSLPPVQANSRWDKSRSPGK